MCSHILYQLENVESALSVTQNAVEYNIHYIHAVDHHIHYIHAVEYNIHYIHAQNVTLRNVAVT